MTTSKVNVPTIGLLTAILFVIGDPSRSQTEQTEQTEQTGPDNEIRFQVTGLHSDEGTLACGLFDASGWLVASRQTATGTIENGSAVCLFSAVEPGMLGISAYHDENANGKLDSTWMRIPKEGTAASHNARGRMGPPKFKDASFEYGGGQLDLDAVMSYR